MTEPQPRPLATFALLGEAFRLARGLLRGEAELARAEMAAKARQALLALAALLMAAILVLAGFLMLAGAGVILLAEAGLGLGPAVLLIALIFLTVSALLIWRALRALQPAALLPRRTVHRIREDAQHITEAFRNGTHR